VFFVNLSKPYIGEDSHSGNDIKTGIMGLTCRNDGRKFVLHDAFMPADCNCSYITDTDRSPFTGEILQANAAIDGLQKIIFEDGVC
jgi:hypothetical protein